MDDQLKDYTGAVVISPPEMERYQLATRFAYRILRNQAVPQEIEFMNRFLALPVDFDTWGMDADTATDCAYAIEGGVNG